MAGPRETMLRRFRFYLSPEFPKLTTALLQEAAEVVQTEAQHLITAGSVSGKAHVPSAPGEPPHNDTGHLKSNIEVSLPSPITARVTSHASYSAVHEFGSSTHPARPFMRPARDRVAPKATAEMIRKLNREIRRKSRG